MRSELLARLGNSPIGSSITIAFDDLLDSVTRGVFRYWRDRSSLTGRVFPMLRSLILVLFSNDDRIMLRNQRVDINLRLSKDREELMEQLRTSALPERLPEGDQLRMELEGEQ